MLYLDIWLCVSRYPGKELCVRTLSGGRFDVTVDSYHLCRQHLYLDYNFEEGT